MSIGRKVSMAALSVLFIAAGAMHFLSPGPYLRIMPPMLPWPSTLVSVSGAAEITGGLGLLVPRLRRWSAVGLIALLVAVFPANIYMAMAHISFPGLLGESWFQWARLPLQFVLIAWVWGFVGNLKRQSRLVRS